MIMEYFSEKGVQQVQEKYKNEIGKEYYFDDSEIKRKLSAIIKQSSAQVKGGYSVLFQADNGIEMLIYKFMPRNKIAYNFHEFDIIRTNI